MELKLHPDAIINFDEKAENLLRKLVINKRETTNEHQFRPDICVDHIIDEAKMKVERTGWIDYEGNEVARFFIHENNEIGLHDDGYKELRKLSEDMQRNKSFMTKVSISFMMKVIFNWLELRYKKETDLKMTEYVIDRCNEEINEFEIWIPISGIHIQSEIKIGKIILKPISKEIIEAWFNEYRVSKGEKYYEDKINDLYNYKFKKLQGFPAAVIKTTAEKLRATEVAFHEAEKSIEMLRVFADENFFPTRRSYCTFWGKENVATTMHLIIQGNKVLEFQERNVEKKTQPWVLDDKKIAKLRETGLDILSDLLEQEKKNEFQEIMLDALTLYSKSSLEREITDKLVYLFASIEMILLKNDSESIQQNIGERMAFLIGKDLERRKSIIKNVKDTYNLRSKFVHHGQNIADNEIIKVFMFNAWTMFITCIHYVNNFRTKEKFIETIEDRKLS